MTPVFCLLLLGGALLAFTISGLSGGGAGLALMPILGLALPIAQVPTALTIGTTTSSLSRVFVFRRHIRWDIVAWFVPAALPSTAIGALLLTRIDTLYLEFVLGLVLAANLVTALRAPHDAPALLFSRPALSLVGAAAGFVSGLTGAVGLLFNRFYLRIGLRKEEIVATRAANELLLHALKLILYTAAGLLTRDALLAGLVVAAAAISASLSLRGVLARVDEASFRRLSHAAMGLGGIAMLATAGQTLFQQNQGAFGARFAANAVEASLHWSGESYALAYARNKGLHFERTIDHKSLPAPVRAKFAAMSADADRVVYEEIFGIAHHSYELSIYRDGRRFKHEG